MKKNLFLTLFFIFLAPLSAEEVVDENVLVIEEEEGQECRKCRRRLCPRYYNAEEERLIEERTEARWPSKREDTILDQILRY